MADSDWIATVHITQHAFVRYGERVGKPTEERIRRHMRKSQVANEHQALRIRAGCDHESAATKDDRIATRYLIGRGCIAFVVLLRNDRLWVLATVLQLDKQMRRARAAKSEEN